MDFTDLQSFILNDATDDDVRFIELALRQRARAKAYSLRRGDLVVWVNERNGDRHEGRVERVNRKTVTFAPDDRYPRGVRVPVAWVKGKEEVA